MKLGGRGGTKSIAGFNGTGGRNNIVMVVGGITSWERMSGSAILAVRRAGFCCWRRKSESIILLILTPRQYSCSVSALSRLKKDSSVGKKVSGSWQAACRQRSRKGL